MVTPDHWPTRQLMAAKFIPAGADVIDLGAGSQGLRDRLPKGCTYTPVDYPEFDMNGRWPVGRWDVAVMLGVIERAADPIYVLRNIRGIAGMLILSYQHGGKRGIEGKAWNSISPTDMFAFGIEAGFTDVEQVATWKFRNDQAIWRMA
jgi:hypothetical protein